MSTQEIVNLKAKEADYHMGISRKRGIVGIAGTIKGLLNLYYENKTYRLVQCGFNPQVIAEGSKNLVKTALMDLYLIVDA